MHGVLLALVLSVLQIEKGRFVPYEIAPLEWVGLLLPSIGFAVLFELAWLAVRRIAEPLLPPRFAPVVEALFLLSHGLVYFLSIDAHTFFLKTGHRPHFNLLAYTTRHFDMLQAVVFSGIDRKYWVRLGASAMAVVAGWIAVRRLRARPAGVSRPALLGAVALGVLLIAWTPISERRIANVARNDLVAFARSLSPELETGLPVEPHLLAPDALYTAPRVARPRERPPNIVLLILESTGAQVTPPFGDRDLMPNLARIADRSLVVESAYSTVSHTSKALVGIHCGMFPRLSMPIVESLEGNLPLHCLPGLLRAVGYRTAFLQTALGGFENRPGLTRNLGFERSAFLETLHRPGFETVGYFAMDEFAMLRPALDWATDDQPAPFLLTLLTSIPHHPYETPGLAKKPAHDDPVLGYRQTLEYQDGFIGELYDQLASTGVLEETVLVIVGDHGEAFGEHLRYQHDAVPYEEVVWVPMMLTGSPSLGPPRRIGGLRHQIDLLPTLLELAGIPHQGTLPGRSLLSTGGHDRVFSSCWYDRFCLAMREGDRKVVYHFGRSPTEVFDLGADPGELDDLSGRLPPAELAELEARVVAFQLSVDGFWSEQPLRDGPEEWWRSAPAEAGADTEP